MHSKYSHSMLSHIHPTHKLSHLKINMQNRSSNTHFSRRHHQSPTSGGASRSPTLIRSKSGSAPQISLHDNTRPNSSAHRSKSTTKPRSTKAYPEHVMNPSKTTMTPISSYKKILVTQQDNNKDGTTFVRFLQRSTKTNSNVVGHNRSSPRLAPTPPSAWALSPARSLPYNSPMPKSVPNTNSSYGNMGKVLKYFKNKKVAPIQEMEYRKYGLFHNYLLQWRYGNARAEAAMASVKIQVEKRLFHALIRIYTRRNSILDKRIHIQRMKHELKLYKIIYSQDCLLKEWAKMESKNSEAVGRVIRKLSAISIRLPLDEDAKGDIFSVSNVMNTAVAIMNSVEATFMKYHYQVERTCYLLTELLVMVKQQKEYLEELENTVSMISSLKVKERSLRAHLIQLRTEQELEKI